MRPWMRPRLLCARSKMIFSVADGAAYLGVSPAVLRRHIAAGEVRAYPWGTGRMVLRPDLDRLRAVLTAQLRGQTHSTPVVEQETLLLG